MASFDPSVIGGIADSAVQSQKDAYTLRDLQFSALAANRQKKEWQTQDAVNNVLKQAGQPKTRDEANSNAEKISKISPQAGRDYIRAYQQGEGVDLDLQAKKLAVAQEQVVPMINSIDSSLANLQQSKQLFDRGQITKAELDARTQKEILPEIVRLKMYNPELAPHLDQFMQSPQNMTYQGLVSAENQTKQGREMAKSRLDDIRAAQSQSRLETYQQNEQSLERERLSLERHRLDSESGERNKPESGYDWKDPNDHSQGEVPIKGGSKDSEKPMTGREAQMFGRIVTSANLGVQAVKNVVELPTGASTGIFGVGASPGKSLLDSGKGVLTNKLSSQDTQDYNVMISGLSRNLSTMETQGIAPQGSFTESFNSVQLREGDTQMTKLRKLAEARQIIEKGLEPALDNPRLPESQKSEVRKLIADVQQAVPFEQHDLTVLRRIQSTHPGMTLQDVIKAKKLDQPDKSSQAAPSNGWGEAQVVKP
jgi:hypothetical protein